MEVDVVVFGPGKNKQKKRSIVTEKLFRLTVNGQELLSLVASPHDPESLVIGFLYLQGLISSKEEIDSLGICHDSGQAVVSIKGELPATLRPTLTSGCGGGVIFNNPESGVMTPVERAVLVEYSPEAVVASMSDLLQVSKQYAVHGGIHSAGLGDGRKLILHAEDLGRHNTIDRIAGAALRQQLDPSGRLLLTSGRISSEMAVKAARLGVAALASRTSPTDLAVKVCEHYQIGLAGYVRSGSMEVFAHAESFGPQS